MPRLHPVVQELLHDIESYCALAKISASKFGLKFLHDKRFVARLKRGSQPRLTTIDKVRSLIVQRTCATKNRYKRSGNSSIPRLY